MGDLAQEIGSDSQLSHTIGLPLPEPTDLNGGDVAGLRRVMAFLGGTWLSQQAPRAMAGSKSRQSFSSQTHE